MDSKTSAMLVCGTAYAHWFAILHKVLPVEFIHFPSFHVSVEAGGGRDYLLSHIVSPEFVTQGLLVVLLPEKCAAMR